MTNLTTFNFHPETTATAPGKGGVAKRDPLSHPVRTATIGGEPWFVAKDVCDVLGIINSRDAIARLDEDERDGVGITDAIGRVQQTAVISESGLYALTLTSNKPEAKAFSRWVRKTVLPTIRKTGSYIAGEESFDVTTEAGLAAATVHVLSALQAKADSYKAQYEAAKPKSDAFKVIEEATGSITVTEAAKALNAKRKDLYSFLEVRKWVTKGTHRQATAAALQRGYMDVRTHTDPRGRVHTSPVVTPKGLTYLADYKAKRVSLQSTHK